MTDKPDRLADHGVLFIVGTGRCGSTIVQEMLARHPDVAFVSNVDEFASRLNLKGTWNNLVYRRIPQRYTQRDRVVPTLVQTRLHFGPSEAYRLHERQVGHLVSTPFRDLTQDDVTPPLARRYRSFVDQRVAAQRKRLFLHKFTGWPRAQFLYEIFPEARFVHVVRDGRAVASSLAQRAWWRGQLGPWAWGLGPLPEAYASEWEKCGRSFVALAGIEWKILIDAAEEAKAHIPEDRWMDVRYEDFVEQPRTHVERVLEWVGLPWTPEFESSFAKYSYGRHRKAAYVKDLRPSQVDMLDRLLDEHLRALGYEVPTPQQLGV